jgi:hypothetical protein
MAINISEIKGKTLTGIDGGKDSHELVFTTSDGEVYKMFHEQDCCESVRLEDIVGELQDLIGSPLLVAYAETSRENPKGGYYEDSFTWTFYRLATIKGSVTLRWYGCSNGYYSERVDLVRVK